MKVALGTFARSGIESRLGGDVAAGVQAALRHYLLRLRSGEQPVGFPDFLRGRSVDPSGADFDLAVDPEIEQLLEREVRRQRATAEQLTVHAVFVFLADLEQGDALECLGDAAVLH
jgi:hypothetical protein